MGGCVKNAANLHKPNSNRGDIVPAIEALGLVAIAIMVASYALEHVHYLLIAIFAIGCALAALYAYLIGSYPFLIAEGIWAVIAFRRWRRAATRI